MDQENARTRSSHNVADLAAATAHKIVRMLEFKGEELCRWDNDGDGYYDYGGLIKPEALMKEIADIIATAFTKQPALIKASGTPQVFLPSIPGHKHSIVNGQPTCGCVFKAWNPDPADDGGA